MHSSFKYGTLCRMYILGGSRTSKICHQFDQRLDICANDSLVDLLSIKVQVSHGFSVAGPHRKKRLIFITINVKCYCYHLYGIIRDSSKLRIVLLPMSAGWCASPHLMINRQLTNQRSCIYTSDIAEVQIRPRIVHYHKNNNISC